MQSDEEKWLEFFDSASVEKLEMFLKFGEVLLQRRKAKAAPPQKSFTPPKSFGDTAAPKRRKSHPRPSGKITCGHTDRQHYAHGMCVQCYRVEREKRLREQEHGAPERQEELMGR